MRFLASLLFLGILLAIPAAAQQKPSNQPTGFFHPQVARDADRYEAYLKSGWTPVGSKKPSDLRASGNRGLGPDPRGASREFANAVVLEPSNAENWLGLARALLAITPDPTHGSERYDLPVNAQCRRLPRLRTVGKPGRQGAIPGRPVGCTAAALLLAPGHRCAEAEPRARRGSESARGLRQAAQRARLPHGRLQDRRRGREPARLPPVLRAAVARPVDFSQVRFRRRQGPAERRRRGAPALHRRPDPRPALRGAGPRGLALGRRRGAREGRRASLSIVHDRKPFVRFTGKSYVLPSRGQQGIPARHRQHRHASTSRSIASATAASRSVLQSGDFASASSRATTLEQLKERTGTKVYQGEMDVSPEAQRGGDDRLPCHRGHRHAAARRLRDARPAGRQVAARAVAMLATQWFIVSDLGLTALNGDDGVHAFVRSLSTARRLSSGANVKLIARNNEVLGTAKTDAAATPASTPASQGAKAAWRRRSSSPKSSGGDYAFLDLTTAAFDLTDRGVKGRDAPGPLDGFALHRARRLPPRREVHLTGSGARSRRPGGYPAVDRHRHPPRRRRALALRAERPGPRRPQSSRCRSATARHDRHLARQLHADPKADADRAGLRSWSRTSSPSASTSSSSPPPARCSPSTPLNVEAIGRYLYGPPAAGLAIEGDIAVKPSSKDVAGFPGYRFGLADEKIEPVRKPLEGLPRTDADGKAALPIQLPSVPKTAAPLEADVICGCASPAAAPSSASSRCPSISASHASASSRCSRATGLKEDETAASRSIVARRRRQARRRDRHAVGAHPARDQLAVVFAATATWTYEPVTITRKIASGTVDTTPDATAKIAAKVDYGRYRLEVASADPDGPAASFVFIAGWFAADDNADSPEMLESRSTRRPTRRAKRPSSALRRSTAARRSSPCSATALPAAGGRRPERRQRGADCSSATTGAPAPTSPPCSIGRWTSRPSACRAAPSACVAGLDQAPRTLNIALDTPEKVKSGSTLTVPVKIAGLAPGEEARVTVAAVDLGILNLTRFESPAPEGLVLRPAPARHRDPRLLRPPDRRHARRARHAALGRRRPRRRWLVDGRQPARRSDALRSSPASSPSAPTARPRSSSSRPTSTARCASWPSRGAKTRSATSAATSDRRDAVALTASRPRFLTLGDEARLDLAVHNVEGPAADYAVAVHEDVTKPGAAGTQRRDIAFRTLPLKALERKAERISIKPDHVGRLEFDVTRHRTRTASTSSATSRST